LSKQFENNVFKLKRELVIAVCGRLSEKDFPGMNP